MSQNRDLQTMRVALCFWGLCRSTHIIIHSIQRHIYKVLEDANIHYDIYLHTFEVTRDYVNERANERFLRIRNDNWTLLEPHVWKIENQDEIDMSLMFQRYKTKGNPWKDSDYPTSWTTFENHIRSLYSLHQVYSLVASSALPYSAIVFLRPDVRYLQSLYPETFLGLTSKDILLPNFHALHGVNDRFAICHPESAGIYASRFLHALEYSKHFPLHSETFLKWIIDKNRLRITLIPFVFQRVRATGDTAQGDQDLTTHIVRHRIQTEQQRS